MSVLATGFLSRELIGAQSSAAIIGGMGPSAAVGFVLAHVLRDRVKPTAIVSGALIVGGAGMLAFGGIISVLGISLMAFTVGKLLPGQGRRGHADAAVALGCLPGRGLSFQDLVYNLSWILPAFILYLTLAEDTARLVLLSAGAVFLAIALLIAAWSRRVDVQPRQEAGTGG